MDKSKGLKYALIASIAINLGIVGFVGAQWYQHGSSRGGHPGMMFDRRAALEELSQDKRAEVRSIWQVRRDRVRGEMKNYIHESRNLAALLTAETLDLEAINETQQKMLAYRMQADSALFETLLQTAKTLNVQEREQFFGIGFKRWKHHPKPPEDKEDNK